MSREKRDKLDKANYDLTKPLDITVFGSENDPCFGKLHDPANNICGRCGDAEICAIVQSQRQHIKRAKEDATNKFKDNEEPFLELNSLDRFLVELLKGKGKMRYAKVQRETIRFFDGKDKTTPDKIKEFLLKYVKRSPKFKRTKKDGKKYLALL